TDDVIYYRDVLKAPMDDPFAHALSVEDLRGLPPTYITAAYFDPLRDDGREFTAQLARAGIDVQYREEPQLIHGWLRARHMSDAAKAGFSHLCAAIAQMV
ncbi:MAG TPA: carboxylesterase, partial [Thalassospira lucentensis]